MATTETKPYFRFLSIEDEEIKDDILTMSVSSEYPVKRGFGEEILEHTPEAIDLKRFNDNAPILWSHNVSEQVGVILRAYLVDKKLKVDMRFGNSAKAKEIEADVLLEYKSIKSSVNGIVFDMKPRNIGFVTQSNFTIMKIVPFNKLEADVKIPSSKIGFIKIGMPVDISIDSFPANDFAPIEGIVESIGSDVLEPDEKFNYYRFPVTVKLTKSFIEHKGKELPLITGMSLSANIILRQRPVISLFTETLMPFWDSLENF